jgi:hypothetical protein
MGAAQTVLLIVGLALAIRLAKAREYRYGAIGAFLGAGLGIAEAFYMSGLAVTYLFDLALVERAAFLFLHTFAGALLGWAWQAGRLRLALTALVVVIVNSLARYLPLLVRGGALDVEMTHLVLVLLVLVFVLATLVTSQRQVRTRGAAGAAEEESFES